MATTTLAFWSEGPEIEESGIVIGGLTVSYAEIELAESREQAIEMGLTTELCDLYEAQGGDYKAGTVRDWLDKQTAEAEALQAEIDKIDAPDMQP